MDSGAALWGLARSAGGPGTSAGGKGPKGFESNWARNCADVLRSPMLHALTLPEARLEMRPEIRLLECLEKAASAVEASVYIALRCASSGFAPRSCPRCNVFSPGRRWKSP